MRPRFFERLARPINFRRVPPPQTVADDVDYSADDTPVIDTWSAVGTREVRFDSLKLAFREPVVIRHVQFLLPASITTCTIMES